LIADAIRATICILVKRGRRRRNSTHAINIRISPNLYTDTDPVSLGDLCQAMFIEGTRVLGIPGRRSCPPESWSKSFLATVMIADGLGLLLQSQYESDGS